MTDNSLIAEKEIRIGETLFNTNRIVIASHKISKEIHNQSYDEYVVICANHDEYHKYVVWNVFDRPEGWYVCNGQYFHSLQQAVSCWENLF